MLPLFSARTRRISKISSCLRMPVAPAISSSLAILVSAEMLISFIADSEMVWAGAPCGCPPCGGLPAGAFGGGGPARRLSACRRGGLPPPLPARSAGPPACPPQRLARRRKLQRKRGCSRQRAFGLARRLVRGLSASRLRGGGAPCRRGGGASAEAGGAAVATPPLALAGLRSSSTVHPVLRPCALRPAARGYQTTIRIHERGAPARRASVCPPWFRRPARGHGCDCSHSHASRSDSSPGCRESTSSITPRCPGRLTSTLRQPIELLRRCIAAARIAVARQIDQEQRRRRSPLHAIEVGQPRLAGRRARARQRPAHQRVDQARFAHVGPPDERDLRQPVTREIVSARGARDELSGDLQLRRPGPLER